MDARRDARAPLIDRLVDLDPRSSREGRPLRTLSREELRESPTLGWLVKVAIMVLGLAPGIRDALRLAMGV